MREIKFIAEYNGIIYNVETKKPLHRDAKGYYKRQGYIVRLTKNHPFSDKRGYVLEHRLVMEEHLKRFLTKNEIIHHKDGNRENNGLLNLQLMDDQKTHAKKEFIGKRNNNGQIVSQDSSFSNIKFRLLNKNTGLTDIFSLSKLIGTTFRRGQFEFRGRWTGLKDKNGKEIYEGDILIDVEFDENGNNISSKFPVVYDHSKCQFAIDNSFKKDGSNLVNFVEYFGIENLEVVGNICDNIEMLVSF